MVNDEVNNKAINIEIKVAVYFGLIGFFVKFGAK
jgi:hypothetical protein